ncbi:MAG: HAMP domain-containing sensor histidine kinase, partial [Chloroflexota bacterium]
IKRLSRLVEDLRVLSRADAHNMEVGHEEVNLVNLIRALQREFDKQIHEKGLTITLDTSEDPFIVKAAATHMRTALRNVLENAIKYNTAGGTVSISLKNVERDQQSFHQLSMIDSGIGIPAEDLPNLTKRFYRVDKAHNRDIPGSGLGLSLVNSIVGLYGGRLEIVSDGVGQGSQVTILLPKGVGS